jgi:hypothetical protein
VSNETLQLGGVHDPFGEHASALSTHRGDEQRQEMSVEDVVQNELLRRGRRSHGVGVHQAVASRWMTAIRICASQRCQRRGF